MFMYAYISILPMSYGKWWASKNTFSDQTTHSRMRNQNHDLPFPTTNFFPGSLGTRSVLLVFRAFLLLLACTRVLLVAVLLSRLCRLFCSFVNAFSKLQGAFHYSTCFQKESVKSSTTAVIPFRWLHCFKSGAHKRDRKQAKAPVLAGTSTYTPRLFLQMQILKGTMLHLSVGSSGGSCSFICFWSPRVDSMGEKYAQLF